MAIYLYRLGRFAARRAWAVVCTWVLLLGLVGGAALSLREPFTKELSIPGTEFQQVLDDLDTALPDAAGGSAGVVFATQDGSRFTKEQKDEIHRVTREWGRIDGVDEAADPFTTQHDLDEGRRKLEDGKKKLADGEKKIRQNRHKMADGRKKLDDGRKKLDSSETQLAQGEGKLAAGQAKIAAGEAEVALNAGKLGEARAKLDEGQAKIDAGAPQLAAARTRLDDGQKQLDAGKARLAAGEKQLADARAKVAAGEKQVAPAKARLAEGERRIADARKKLDDGDARLRAGRQEVASGRAKLDDARRQIDALAAQVGDDDPRVVQTRARLDAQAAQLNAAQQRLDASAAELKRGRAALDAQAKQLEAGKAELTRRTAPLVQARRTLDTKTAELAAGKKKIAQNQAKIDSGRRTLAAKAQELEEGRAQIAAGRAKLAAGQAKLDAGRAKLQQGQAQIDANRAKIDSGKAQITQGRLELDKAAAQLNEGAAKLDDARTTIAEKKQELHRGERRLALMDGLRAVNERGDTAVTTVRFEVPINEVTPETKAALPEAAKNLAAAGVDVDYSQQIAEDVQVGGASEVVGLAVAAVILLVMLGSLLAAGLPLLIALVGLSVGMLGMLAMTHWVQMTDVTPALAVMLGLAVGIDYALFIVHRHREILASGVELRESIGRATGTAGSAVLFAGMTVVVALAALTLTGIPFLGVMGLAAAGTVVAAVVVALTLTPALLSLIGPRVLSRAARRRLQAQHEREEAEAALEDEAEIAAARRRRDDEADAEKARLARGHGWGGFVTRHPVLTLLASAALLLGLATPAASLRLGLPDASQSAHDSTAYREYTRVAEGFGPGQNAAILAVAKVDKNEARRLGDGELTDLQLQVAEDFAQQDGVEYVVPAAISDDHRTLVYQIVPEGGPNDESTAELIHHLRDDRGRTIDATALDSIGFAGQTVANIDMSELLAKALPTYLAVVVGISIVLLLLVFRSLLVPLLATGGFLLSVAASFGAVVAVYQWGHLGSLFGVESPGVILSFLPTLVIGILFGLAMDYQMFLVSGMREAWAHGHTARTAVRTGFSHGAKVVTAAALIMMGVFTSFVYSPTAMIRPIGFALAAGVLFDAFVVRITMMPAIMHLLGEKAWYLPGWLGRMLPDLDVEGTRLVAMREEQARAGATDGGATDGGAAGVGPESAGASVPAEGAGVSPRA